MDAPGFTEMDLVSHGGDWAEGEFAHSLNVVDIHSAWVEARAVLGKSQARVQAALETLREALPCGLRGIDSELDARPEAGGLRAASRESDALAWNAWQPSRA